MSEDGSGSNATAPPTTSEVLADVTAILRDVLGDEYLSDEVTLETSFADDLQLESIEFVALSDFLQQRYEQVDFMAWLAEMEFEEIMSLRVGQLVEFIASCLT